MKVLCPFLCAQVFADQRQFLSIRKFKDDETAEIRVHAIIYRRGNGSPERLSDSITPGSSRAGARGPVSLSMVQCHYGLKFRGGFHLIPLYKHKKRWKEEG